MPWLFFFSPSPRILTDPVGQHLPPLSWGKCLPARPAVPALPFRVCSTDFLCLCRTDSWPPGFDHVLWNVGRLVEMFSVLLTSVCCAYTHFASDSVCSRSPLSSETLCHQKHLPGCLGSAKWSDLEDLALGWTGAGRDRSSGRTLGDHSSVTKVL